MEYWDVCDINGNPTGRIVEKGFEDWGEKEYHMAAEAWIMNDKGEYLIQQRSMECELYPGIWALTTGRLRAGETTIEGCIRECGEELGFTATEDDITFLNRITRYRSHMIFDEFLVYTEVPVEEMVFQKEEVAQARFVTADELKVLIDHEDIFVYDEILEVLAQIEEIKDEILAKYKK